MEFVVLGPISARRDGVQVRLGGGKRRVLLAVLLANANREVSTDRLIGALWGAKPPASAAKNLQVNIWQLRRLLDREGRLGLGTAGYALRVDAAELDAARFERLAGEGRAARAAGCLDRAAALFRQALQLWQGGAYAGTEDVAELALDRQRLNQLRLAILEEGLAVALARQPPGELVADLRAAVAANPLRESLHELLMTALYQAGQRGEALAAYQDAYRMLRAELGVEPGPRLRALQRLILDGAELPPPEPGGLGQPGALGRADGAGQPAAGGPVDAPRPALPDRPAPVMLPADIGDFTGRAEQVRLLSDALAATDRQAVPVIVLCGAGGIGKTTLAVHVAHLLRDRFPDGVLYLNLYGAHRHPVTPLEALGRLLRALGVPAGAIPPDLDECASLYRAQLADRRVLVVLDDAGTEEQIAPLLPGVSSCAVLVTSRIRLAGAGVVALDVLDEAHSVDLLSRIAGPDRIAGEPAAVAELVRLCGGLPLALRICGGRLASRPHWRIGQLTDRLLDERRRLDELATGQLAVRGSLGLSYDCLDPPARTLLRRMALLDTPDMAGWLAAALLDTDLSQAEDTMEQLVAVHLVDVAGRDATSTVRYRMHDLVRVFARERVEAEEPADDRQAALIRGIGALLYLAQQANTRVWGRDETVIHSDAPRWELPAEATGRLLAAPMLWFLAERAGIRAAVRQAADAGRADLAWDLAVTAAVLYQTCSFYEDWRDTHERALAACRAREDRRGEAAVRTKLGWLEAHLHRPELARVHLDRARQSFQDLCEPHGEALARHALAYVEHLHGRHELALRRHHAVAQALLAVNDRTTAGHALRVIGQIYRERGERRQSREYLDAAMALAGPGDEILRGMITYERAQLDVAEGRLAPAEGALQRVLAVTQRNADLRGQAFVLRALAELRRCQGRVDEAEQILVGGRVAASKSADRVAESQVLAELGRCHRDQGRYAEAMDCLRQAASLAESVRVPLHRALALRALGQVCHLAGDAPAAAAAYQEAASLTRRFDLPGGPDATEQARTPVAVAATPGRRHDARLSGEGGPG